MSKLTNQSTGDENAKKSVNATGPSAPSPSFGAGPSNGCYFDREEYEADHSLAQKELESRS